MVVVAAHVARTGGACKDAPAITATRYHPDVDDVEGFIAWMRARGTPEQHLPAHRHYALELSKHPSLSAALRAEEEAGSPANRIANIRQVAARIAEFHSGHGVEVHDASPVRQAPASLALEVEAPRAARATVSPRRLGLEPPRRGCECRERQDIYVDNDFGAMASMLGGGLGIGTIVLIKFVGVIGALAIALGLASLGGLATTMSICFRCHGCRCKVRDLDADESGTLGKGRALVAAVTLALMAGSGLCGYLWYSAMKARLGADDSIRHSRPQQQERQPAEPEPAPEP